eukprot:m.77240 g.77240  ORF g.77240 m.77240 type:complete len:534 (-) comp50490_c0_seq11:49-1650(-)
METAATAFDSFVGRIFRTNSFKRPPNIQDDDWMDAMTVDLELPQQEGAEPDPGSPDEAEQTLTLDDTNGQEFSQALASQQPSRPPLNSLPSFPKYNDPAPDPGPYFASSSKDTITFELRFPEERPTGKTVSWVFSPVTQQMFVARNVIFPVAFLTTEKVPAGTILRATPRYLKAEHAAQVVQRCPNHASEWSQDEVCPAIHVLRCESSIAAYVTDPISSRHSVWVPCALDSDGKMAQTELFRIMCYSSCSGGLGRRPIGILFTLELNQTIFARVILPIRVCACPGRDLRVAEMANGQVPSPLPMKPKQKAKQMAAGATSLETAPAEMDTSSNSGIGAGNSASAGVVIQTVTALCKTLPEDDMDAPAHSLMVQGAEHAEVLCRVLQGLQRVVDAPVQVTDPRVVADFHQQQQHGLKHESAEKPSTRASPGIEALKAIHDIDSWLTTWGLKQYAPTLRTAGYDDLELLGYLDVRDLKLLGVSDAEDRSRFLEASRLLHHVPPAAKRHGCFGEWLEEEQRVVRVTVRRNTQESLAM